jgi:NADH:ubiquinone reductase (non-electrogenic)
VTILDNIFRSIIEPVRNVRFRQTADFHLSYATKVDRENKVLHCESVLQPELGYKLNYDKLVPAVGARSNTFNVPGVEEHAFFLKVLSL